MKRLFGGHETTAEPFRSPTARRSGATASIRRSSHVLRKHGTERAGTSPLNREKRDGTFICAGCGSRCLLGDEVRERHRLAELL